MLRNALTLHLILCFTVAQAGAQEHNIPRSARAMGPSVREGGSVDWGEIGVLDLATAQQIALAGNPSLAGAGDRVRQAQARVFEARAAYFPRLDANASASRVDFAENYAGGVSMGPPATADGFADPEDYYQAGLVASWVVFDGLGRKFSNAIARFGEQESEAARMETQRLLLSAVANAYYAAQLARAEIAIATADEAFNLRQLREAEARREKGTGSLSDQLNFEVRVNSAKSQRITAERIYEVALIGLAELMGLPEAAIPSRVELAGLEDERSEELELPDAEPELDYALERRADVIQGEYILESARAGVGFARSDYYPTINVSASVDASRSNSARFEQDDFGNTVALFLAYNLFDGGGRRARVRGAKASLDEAERNLESIKIAVAAEVRQALARLRSAQDQMVLQRENVRLVQRTRDLVEKEYTAGQSSLVRLNEAQRDLTNAQSRLVLALVSLRQAWHDLETATGGILASMAE
jgi:outer membrane protein